MADPATKPCMENAILGQLVPRTSFGAFVDIRQKVYSKSWATFDLDIQHKQMPSPYKYLIYLLIKDNFQRNI